jgi:hypothetical protein
MVHESPPLLESDRTVGCQKGGIVRGQKDSSEDEGCWFLMLKKRSASDADSLDVDGNKVKIIGPSVLIVVRF